MPRKVASLARKTGPLISCEVLAADEDELNPSAIDAFCFKTDVLGWT